MGKPSREERLELGKEAERLLADGSLFNRIVNTCVTDSVIVMSSSPPNADLALSQQAVLFGLNAIKDRIRSIANDGIVASKEK